MELPLSLTWDLWRAARGGAAAVAARQQARLASLVAHARRASPFYQRLYQGLPEQVTSLEALPPVAKADLMANFDAWVTDPAITRSGVEAFMADATRVAQAYLGRFAAWCTSGTTGVPGLFVHDAKAQAVYDGLLLLRGCLGWLRLGEWVRLLGQRGVRLAFVVAVGAHFAGISLFEHLRRRFGWAVPGLGTISALLPQAEIVSALIAFQPTILAGYPSALRLLARERAAGRLAVHPLTMMCAGETLDTASQAEIEAAFGCALHDLYGASEFPVIAVGCRQGWRHVNADWVMLEPVDQVGRPVPAGEPSRSVRLTNLANWIQPIIRYDLGDSITVRPDPCPCGNPLPAIRVEGRKDDILRFVTAAGRPVDVLPMALAAVIEGTAGVERYQCIQIAPDCLELRLAVGPGADGDAIWTELLRRLTAYLATLALDHVDLRRAADAPQPSPVSGKFRQIWSALSGAG